MSEAGPDYIPGAVAGKLWAIQENASMTSKATNRIVLEMPDLPPSLRISRLGVWFQVLMTEGTGAANSFTITTKAQLDAFVESILLAVTLQSAAYGPIIPADTNITKLRNMMRYLFGSDVTLFDQNDNLIQVGVASSGVTVSTSSTARIRGYIPFWQFVDASDSEERPGVPDFLRYMFAPSYAGINTTEAASQYTVLWGAFGNVTFGATTWAHNQNSAQVTLVIEGEDVPDGEAGQVVFASPLCYFTPAPFGSDVYRVPGKILTLACYREDDTLAQIAARVRQGGTPGPGPYSILRYTVNSGAGVMRTGTQPSINDPFYEHQTTFDRHFIGTRLRTLYGTAVDTGPFMADTYGVPIISPPRGYYDLWNGKPDVMGQFYGSAVATGAVTLAYAGVAPLSDITPSKEMQRAASQGAAPLVRDARLTAALEPYLPRSYALAQMMRK